jgi:1-acyl-sn-glycerol-3-phosphate acyltransferase
MLIYKNFMFNIFVTVYTWIYVFISLVLYFPIACLIWAFTILFDKRLRLLHLFTSFWGVSFVWINPFIKIKIEGRENIRKGEKYIMICNHQSLLDIVVLFGIFKHFKWVAKKELFNIPIVGWNMSLNKYIPVDRANKNSHAKMFMECAQNLAIGNSIMIFPEGTRSVDGQIHHFKEGAFKMALSSKCSILPIVLDGTSNALPKKGFVFRNLSNIKIRIFPPVPYAEFSEMSSKDLSVRFYNDLTQKYQQLQSGK